MTHSLTHNDTALLTGSSDLPEKALNWKFQCNACMFTYKTHLNKKAFQSHFEALTKSSGIEFIRLAHETGKEGEYDHTHVLVKFKKRFVTTDVRFFDYIVDDENLHPNIKYIDMRGKGIHFINAKSYIAKEDPENADLKKKDTESMSKFDQISECKTIQEAMKCAKKFSDANGIATMFSHKSQDYSYWTDLFKDFIPYIWQKSVIDIVNLPPPKRGLIHWFYETIGNVGKSEICNYLDETLPNKTLLLCGLPSDYHASTIIFNAIQAGWDGTCVLIDFPRTYEDHVGWYTTIEQILNGRMTAQKFNGKTFRFPKRPHVIVFANWVPKTHVKNEHGVEVPLISVDRWRWNYITEDNCKHPPVEASIERVEPTALLNGS